MRINLKGIPTASTRTRGRKTYIDLRPTLWSLAIRFIARDTAISLVPEIAVAVVNHRVGVEEESTFFGEEAAVRGGNPNVHAWRGVFLWAGAG